MWLKVVLTAYPEVKVQGPDLVRVVGIVAPLTLMGACTRRGKIALSSPRGELGTYDMCRVPLAAESQAKFRPCRDCRRFL